MAFDTLNERLAIVASLGTPVPVGLPEAAGSFSDAMACVFLKLFPSSSLPSPVPVVPSQSTAAPFFYPPLKMNKVLR